MITQALKRWLQKIARWFSGTALDEAEYAHVPSTSNKGITQEPAARTGSDAILPHSGIAPRIAGQSETSCSTIDEWPERVIQSTPPPTPNEIKEPTVTPASFSITPPMETSYTTQEHPVNKSQASIPETPTPTPQQHLEFLQYLVKRGIVNEGFVEGQVPEQYKRRT